MSLFSKSRKTQPEAGSSEAPLEQPAPPQAEPAPAPWVMTEEHYKALTQKLDLVLENVGIVNDNVRLAISRVNTLQEDMGVSISNDHLMERYFKEVQDDLQRIKRAVNN